MSVIVVARLHADPAKVEALFKSHKSDFEAIAADAKKAGALHHQFLAGEGVTVIVDEWTTAEAFQTFFADPRIASLMQEAGVAEAPQILIYEQMDSPDRF